MIIQRDIFNNVTKYNSLRSCVLKAVFTSKPYRRYLDFLKENGLSRSAILGRIPVKEFAEDEGIYLKAFIGPHISDADIFLIILRYNLMNNYKVDSFKLANQIRDEIIKNNAAPIMMLDKTNMQLLSNGTLLIHPDMAYGEPKKFLDKYSAYVPDDIFNKFQVVEASRHFITPGNIGIKVNTKEFYDFRNKK